MTTCEEVRTWMSVRPLTREEVARDLSVRPLTLEDAASGRISFTDTTPRRIDGGEDPATLYVTAETDGDGACPLHAAFGIPDCISRQLTRPNARDTAADVLNTVFLLYVNHQSMGETVKHYFELVVSSVWEEFVRTVALGYVCGPRSGYEDHKPVDISSEAKEIWRFLPQEHRDTAIAHVRQELEESRRNELFYEDFDRLTREFCTAANEPLCRSFAIQMAHIPANVDPRALDEVELVAAAAANPDCKKFLTPPFEQRSGGHSPKNLPAPISKTCLQNTHGYYK